MDPKAKLAALQAEAKSLLEKQDRGEFTDEDAARAMAIGEERKSLEQQIDVMEKASRELNAFSAGRQDNDTTETDTMTETGTPKTLGERFVASESYKAYKDRHPTGSVPKGAALEIRSQGKKRKTVGRKMTRKDLLTTGETGNVTGPIRTNEVEDLVYRPPRRLLDVVTTGTTDLQWFEYRQVISKINNAAIVPEATSPTDDAALKPVSGLTTKTAEAKAHTYADGMEVTNQELADDGVIQSLIDSTLAENLEIAIENILLNGAGTNDEPAGILNTSGVLQQDYTTDMPTTIRKAITLLTETSGAQIRGVLLNPQDDEAWDLLTDSHGDWIGNGPFGQGPGSAWGYERIVSQAIPVGTALIGDFSTVHLLEKDPLEVLAFNQHKDYAQRNLTYIRAELRALQLIRNAARLAIADLKAGESGV